MDSAHWTHGCGKGRNVKGTGWYAVKTIDGRPRLLLPLCASVRLLVCLRFPKHLGFFRCLTLKMEPFTPLRGRGVQRVQLTPSEEWQAFHGGVRFSHLGGHENHVGSSLRTRMLAPPREWRNYVSVCGPSSAGIPISVHTYKNTSFDS